MVSLGSSLVISFYLTQNELEDVWFESGEKKKLCVDDDVNMWNKPNDDVQPAYVAPC